MHSPGGENAVACQEAVSDLPSGRSRHHCPLRPHLEHPELLVLELAMLAAVRPAVLEELATAMLQCLVGLLVEPAVYGLVQRIPASSIRILPSLVPAADFMEQMKICLGHTVSLEVVLPKVSSLLWR